MSTFKKVTPSVLVIILYFVVIPLMNFNHHKYARGEEGIIKYDIKSYYAYLPALFIYNDLSLGFMNEEPGKFNKWIWPVETPTGEKAILTTMGMSVMYTPLFLIAHQAAKFSDQYEADGYSQPYHVALTFSAWIYFVMALIFLRKLLLKYYSEQATAITLLAVAAGTNLMHYLTYEAPMSHAYSFSLIVLLIYVLDRWHASYNWRQTILLGLLAGLITLIRPSNISILLLIPLWGIHSIKTFRERYLDRLGFWLARLGVMAVAFIIVWTPQFLYWHSVSGQLFFYSYGEVGGSFFFGNPQIWNVLFSFKKGWFIYTPVMLVATVSIYLLFKQKRHYAMAVLVFFLVNLYIISSWWSWWYGGGFSIRACIDSYGLMALPLAALIDHFKHTKKTRMSIISLLVVLMAYNEFQIQQYKNVSIHYFWMNREAYWETFLKLEPTCKFEHLLKQPNVEKAREGIYEAIPYEDTIISRQDLYNKVEAQLHADSTLLDSLTQMAINKNSNFKTVKTSYINDYIDKGLAREEYKELRIAYIKEDMEKCDSWRKEIERKARRRDKSFEEVAHPEAHRIFEEYAPKYIPME